MSSEEQHNTLRICLSENPAKESRKSWDWPEQENNTNKENHYRMWTWLAENPNKGKYDWPEWNFNGGTILSAPYLCFACAEASENLSFIECSQCPIKWSKEELLYVDEVRCLLDDSLFVAWDILNNKPASLKKRAALALQIRDAWK